MKFNFIYTILISASIFGCSDDSNQVIANTPSTMEKPFHKTKLGEQDESLLISQDDLQKIMSLINSRKNLKTKITTISEAIQQIPHSPTNNKDFSDKKGLVTYQLNEIENEINSEIEMCEKILETQSSTVAINQGFYDKMGSRYESKCSMIRRVVEKFNEILVNKGMSPIAIPDLVNTESSHSVKDTGSKFDPRSNNPNIDMDIVQQVKNIVQRNFEYEHKKYEYEEYEDEDEDEGEDEYEEEIDYIKMNKDIRKQ